MNAQFANFQDFQDTLMQHLPGALPHAVEQSFFTHARRFYRRTRAWQVSLPGLCLSPCSLAFSLNPVDQFSDVCFLESATLGNMPMTIAVGGDPWGAIGRPSRVWLASPHEAHVWPTPTAPIDDAMTLVLSVQPNRDKNRLPPEALTHHYEGLISGVLGDMLSQQKKPYTDASLGALHSRRFETEISRTIAARVRGYAERSMFARPPVVPMR